MFGIKELAKFTGGILGDTVEVIKTAADEISEIPSEIQKGFNEGLIIDPNSDAESKQQEIINENKDKKEAVEPEESKG